MNDVLPGRWTVLAVALSTLLFAAGHAPHEWLGCVAYGLLMCGLWIVRKDLLSCIVAHAVTNIGLAFVVRGADLWRLW